MGAQRIVKPAPEKTLLVYTVDEPVCMPADRVVAAVTAPPVEPGDLETLASDCTGPTPTLR